MRNCIPDELFNLIPYPGYGYDEIGLDQIFRETRYKINLVPDLVIKKEIWHSICDLCERTGVLLEKATGTGGSCEISPKYGTFMRLVGAGTTSGKTKNFMIDDNQSKVYFTSDEDNYIIYSVRPDFATEQTKMVDGEKQWYPTVPSWFIDKYGECVCHGTLMRVYAMSTKPWADLSSARMHAVAYNNDLNKISFGKVTSGMRKNILIDVEDWLLNSTQQNGNG